MYFLFCNILVIYKYNITYFITTRSHGNKVDSWYEFTRLYEANKSVQLLEKSNT